MSAATATAVVWPAELGAPEAVHPWWCARVAGCAGGHRSAGYTVGPVTVEASATPSWVTTVCESGGGPLDGPQERRLGVLRRLLADPAGIAGR